MSADDLNLKTKIKISDKELDFEIWSVEQGRITETKLDGQTFTLTDSNENTDTVAEKPVAEESTIEELSKRKMTRAPNNTLLFLNWLKELKQPEFDISDFTDEYSSITTEQAKLIVAQQIAKDRLHQMSNTRFKILERDESNG